MLYWRRAFSAVIQMQAKPEMKKKDEEAADDDQQSDDLSLSIPLPPTPASVHHFSFLSIFPFSKFLFYSSNICKPYAASTQIESEALAVAIWAPSVKYGWSVWKGMFSDHITGWAVALTCYISHSAEHWKMADFYPSGTGNQNPWTDFDETWHGWLRLGPHPTWQHWWG